MVRDDSRVEIRDGEGLVAEAKPVELDVEVPAPVSVDEAERASAKYAGFEHHAYDTCFVCGPARADGLRVYAEPVEGRDGIVASPWTPPEDVEARARLGRARLPKRLGGRRLPARRRPPRPHGYRNRPAADCGRAARRDRLARRRGGAQARFAGRRS